MERGSCHRIPAGLPQIADITNEKRREIGHRQRDLQSVEPPDPAADFEAGDNQRNVEKRDHSKDATELEKSRPKERRIMIIDNKEKV
jgi:hypothetical protein